MKKLSILFLLFTICNCDFPKVVQTIYTPYDIMYVDYQKYQITYETKPDTSKYSSLKDLQEAVEQITANASNAIHQTDSYNY